MDRVRIGFVGVGGMGTVHVENLVRISGARITAVCDIVEAHARRASGIITKAGQSAPTLYTRGPTDFVRLCETEDLDLVFTATPWEWHVPVCVAAMRNGKHAATEVPAAITLEECWQLVEEAERHRKHCLMMENCNYDRMELLVLNLVRQGVLGEVLHGEGGYLHDLREIKFASTGEGLWRRGTASGGTAISIPRTASGRSPIA
jgi:predicted dehydrogenase